MKLTKRRVAAGLAGTAAGLVTLTALVLSTRQPEPREPLFGFAYVGGPLDQDLRAVNATAFYSYDAPNNPSTAAEADRLGLPDLRLLRFRQSCPLSAYACWANVTPADMADFARQYPGRIYQLGNEPNLAGQDGCGGCPEYFAWFDVFYEAITRADPNARIAGPGVFNWDQSTSGYGWIPSGKDFYRPGLRANYTALHVYPGQVNGAWSYCGDMPGWQTIARQQVSGAASLGKPVIVSEFGLGWPKCTNPPSAEVRYRNFYDFVAWLRTQPYLVMALTFSNRYATADPYSWLVNDDGSLTPEGQAFVDARGGRPAVAPAVPAPGSWRNWLPISRREPWRAP